LRGGTTVHASAGWTRLGLPAAPPASAQPSTWRWRSEEGRGYALAARRVDAQGEELSITVAEDEEPVRGSLAALALVLLLGLPAAVAAAFAGGWLLAGRLLAPVGAMAEAAGRITAERLSERLPVS